MFQDCAKGALAEWGVPIWHKSFPNTEIFKDPKFFLPKMNFNATDLWREKRELLNLRLSKLARAKVLIKLEFDTKDQVLS